MNWFQISINSITPSMNWVEEDGIMRLPKTPNNWRRWFAAHFGKFPYHESIVYDKIPNSPIIGKNGVYPYGVYYTLDSWGYHFEGFSQHFSPTPPLGDTIKASCSDFPLFSQLSSFTRNLSTPDNPITEPSRAGSLKKNSPGVPSFKSYGKRGVFFASLKTNSSKIVVRSLKIGHIWKGKNHLQKASIVQSFCC